MQSRLGEIRAREGEVLAISVDPPEQSLRLVQKRGFQFPILSDTAGKVMDQFGLRHQAGAPSGADVPRPAVFILDRQGKITWKSLAENYRVRPRVGEILRQLETIR